jgi:hypothetical protein
MEIPITCDVMCPICYDVLCDPVELHCGHPCCLDHVKKMDKCPICAIPALVTQWKPNYYLSRMTNNTVRCCKYERNGCAFKGNRSEVEQHSVACSTKPVKVLSKLKIHKVRA